MWTSRVAGALVLALGIVSAAPAHAIFIPGIRLLTPQKAAEVEQEPYWKRLQKRFRRTVGDLALNLDYHYGTQDFSNLAPSGPLPSEAELNSYVLRPELVVSEWLSVYGIGALHDGRNRYQGGSIDLDGWGAGVGVTTAFGPLEVYPSEWPDVAIDPLFVAPDFNWTYNDFQGIENGVTTSNLTVRIGTGGRTLRYSWALWAGPMYQSSTRDLDLRFGGSPVTVRSEPQGAWSGVIGAAFGLRVAEDKRTQRTERRPTLMATIEGGVGNRQGVLVSLRYEFDPFRRR